MQTKNIDNKKNSDSPFHSGEQEIQTRLGVRDQMERFGKQVIVNFIPRQHREFYQQLPFILLGHADENSWPWATMLFNEPGFISSENRKKLTIHSKPIEGEPFAKLLTQKQHKNTRIGLLGIELSSRRRNRLAGHITQINNNAIEIEVDQAFGNCPQYIQTRKLKKIDAGSQAESKIKTITQFDQETEAFIKNSDTFFVASYVNNKSSDNINKGVDVSHRGGKPGFIRVDNNNTLTIPDYLGNFHFNTLGNFLLTPKAGLLFPDFKNGHLLTLTGTVEILWDTDEAEFFEGAERLWRFKLDHGYWIKNALPLRWKLDNYSANTLMTGTWDDAEKKRRAEAEKNQWQPFTITKITNESSVIKSFNLTPEKNERPAFSPGQFITVKATINNQEVIRTYTLSSSPHDHDYRISIKRETATNGTSENGVFSCYLHDKMHVGDTLQIKAASGNFIFDAKVKRPAVLIAGGIGITPMISMVRYAQLEAIRTRTARKVTLICAAHDHSQRAFFEELKEIELNAEGNIQCFWALSNISEDLTPGEHFHYHGHISQRLLQAVLPLDDYDFYLCGPAGFMQSIYKLLRDLGISDERISAESFGPASLVRENNQATKTFEQKPVAEEAIIEFTQSRITQPWTKNDGTLLAFAEAHGLQPEYGCRSGQCGSCKVKLISGKVSYNQPLQTSVNDNEVLLCCAMPARSSKKDMVKIKIDL